MTEEIEIDFGSICRFCLTETDSGISIFDQCVTDLQVHSCQDTIFNFVLRFTHIKENTLRNLPTLVCKECYNLISICYNFSILCQQSDQSLQECYLKTLSETKSKLNQNESNLYKNISNVINEEVICKKENTLFGISDLDETDEKTQKNKISSGNVNNSTQICKIERIETNYQNLNPLSQNLKDAKVKLKEGILETDDTMIDIVKEDNSFLKTTNEKVLYSCSQCSLNFNSSESLNFHFTAVHKEFRKFKNIFEKFECIKCIENFPDMQKLLNHYQSIHSNLKLKHRNINFFIAKKTPNIKKKYLRNDQLVKHLKSNHKNCENIDPSVTDIKDRDSGDVGPHSKENAKTFINYEVNEVIEKDSKSEISKNNNNNSVINGLKVLVCTDCSPPASFTSANECLKHKTSCHDKSNKSLLPKELPDVRLNSLSTVDRAKVESSDIPFKVFCKNCTPPLSFTSIKAFVSHMHSHDVPEVENWEIEHGKPSIEDLSNNLEKGSDQKKWKCSECPSMYYRRHSLCYHMKEKHNKSFNLAAVKCPECNETFVTNRRLLQHGISAHEKYFAQFHKVFKRKILQSASDGETEEDKNKVKIFECDICQKKYSCKNSLKRHILKTHFGKSETKTVVCSYCGKTLSSKLNLKSHVEFVHEALFVSCPICKKKINFRTIGKHYKTHQQVNSELRNLANQFLCNLCGKILKSKKSFEDHQKLHKNIRDQLCDVCGSGFTTKKFLHLHKKTHEGITRKVYGCSQCEKVFSGRHTLNRHLLTHTGEKNFICEICSKCFYTLQELNRHVRYHKKDYRYDCQLCEMRFLDKSRFRHHMMRHRNIRPHKCQFCDKMFIVKRKMNLHMAAKHNVQVKSTKVTWKDPKTYIPLDDLL